MGTLEFSDLEIKALGKDVAVAHGRWQLTRAKDVPHGRFTLIFRRTGKNWRIVHDHTSFPLRYVTSAVNTAFDPLAAMLSPSAFAPKPAKTTECIAPMRTVASISTI